MSKKRIKARGNTESSGIISKQIRNILSDNDNKIESFPLYKTVDGDKFPLLEEAYDDNRTVIFEKGKQIHYPSGLSENDTNNITNKISTPNADPDIITTGDITPESVTRSYVKSSTEYQHSFFDESLVTTPSESSFYASASNPEDVGLGFDQNLGTRTSININLPFSHDLILGNRKVHDISNDDDLENVFYIHDGTSNISEWYKSYNSPMAYYDFTNKNWEYLGDISNGIYLNNSQASYQDFIDTAPIGFGPGGSANNENLPRSSSLATPISNFGFPFDSRYHGFDNNILKMSNYIDKPFLFEKLEIEFSFTSRGQSSLGTYFSLPCSTMLNFFILNQRSNLNKKIITGSTDINTVNHLLPVNVKLTNPFNKTVNRSTFNPHANPGYGYSSSGHANTYKGDFKTSVKSIDSLEHRDLVTFSRFYIFNTGSYAHNNPAINININKVLNEVDGYYYNNDELHPNVDTSINITNKKNITLKSNVVTSKKQELAHEIGNLVVGNKNGGRDLLGTNTGRSLTRPINSVEIDETIDYVGSSNTVKLVITKNTLEKSPYVLLPDDKLIFGIHNSTTSDIFASLQNVNFVRIHSGSVNFKLYGTLLRNNEHVKDFRNKNLSSNNIRTSIIGNTFVSDQFDCEPLYLLSGSYIEKIVEGSKKLLEGTSGVSVGPKKYRGVVGNKSNGDNGTFSYKLKAFENNHIFYDSIVPNPLEIHKINNATLDNGNLIVKAGDISSNQSSVDNSWARAFPFESKYNSLLRNLSINLEGFGVTKLSVSGSGISGAPDSPNTSAEEILINKLNFYYGWSDDTFYGMPKKIIRGYKYGLLNANPIKPKAVYRYNKYGQVRDMLEQRLYSALYRPDNTVEYPITKIFKDSKENIIDGSKLTNTYNISLYATSSKPFIE